MTTKAGSDAVDNALPSGDSRSLAHTLTPALLEACNGRLFDIAWFRTDWQHGGAATAKGRWHDDQLGARDVIVKLPVNARELQWTQRLQDARDQLSPGEPHFASVVPRLFQSNIELGGYDFAWIVIEALPHGPLAVHWDEGHIPRIAAAAARFYHSASGYTVDRAGRTESWPKLLDQARESVKMNDLGERRRWQEAHKRLQKSLEAIVAEWNSRTPLEWLHGDLHPANCMCRTGAHDAPVVLIDLAEVHAGHWIEDAIYLERLLWARPDRLKVHKPVKAIAEARRALGLPCEGDYQRLAAIRRLLLAATAPAFLRTEGNATHLSACCERMEQSLTHLHC